MPEPLSSETQKQLFGQLLEKMLEAVVVFDQDQLIRYWNPHAEAIFGVSADAAIGQSVRSLLETTSPDGQSDAGKVLQQEFVPAQICRRDGKETSILVDSNTVPVVVDGLHWSAAFFRDVTAERDQTRRLARAAATDPLSGLLNRRGFQEQLERELSGKISLAIVDADNFKKINDTYGHAAGDQGIQFIAATLRACFPNAMCLARLGGDEFGVVTKTMSADQTNAAYQKFVSQVSAVAPENAETLRNLTVSVGVAISNVEGTSARELLTTADRALYAAKEAGRNKMMSSMINV